MHEEQDSCRWTQFTVVHETDALTPVAFLCI